MKHRSRRCTRCGINWPNETIEVGGDAVDFNRCPDCNDFTWGSISEPTFDADEFQRQHSYRLFERYLEDRENADRSLIERVDPDAFAQYLMDSAAEQIAREQAH